VHTAITYTFYIAATRLPTPKFFHDHAITLFFIYKNFQYNYMDKSIVNNLFNTRFVKFFLIVYDIIS